MAIDYGITALSGNKTINVEIGLLKYINFKAVFANVQYIDKLIDLLQPETIYININNYGT